MQKIAAIYARVSSKKQKEGETILSQIDALRNYAEEHGYLIPNGWEFKDEGFSGSVLQRPALDELRDLAREGSLNAILVFSPDRLSRKYAYQLLLKEEWNKTGTEVIFLKCPAANTPEEQLSLHFQGIFAEYERAQIAERCRRGRIYKARQGNVAALPSIPYGYKRIKNDKNVHVEIDKESSAVVKEIFRLYTREGLSFGAIGRHLDSLCIKPPKGGLRWDRVTIKGILENPAYTGSAYFGKTEKSEGTLGRIVRHKAGKRERAKYPRKKRPMDLWIEIPIPAFISESDFQLVHERLKKNKIHASRNTKEPSLLQGLLVCGECGKSYYKKIRTSGNKKLSYYCCRATLIKGESCLNRSLRLEEMDQIVFDNVIELLKNPLLIEEEIKRRLQQPSEAKIAKEIDLQKELLQVCKARNKLLDAYQDGEALGLDELRERMEKLNKRKNAIENELKRSEALRLQNETSSALSGTLEQCLKQLGDASTLPFTEKRKMIRLLIEEIVIKPKEIRIKHCIPLSAQSKNSLLCDVGRFRA